jgi:hypothetical protein
MSSGAESSSDVAAKRLNQAGLLVLLVAVSIVVLYLAVSLLLTVLGIGTGISVDACLTSQPPGHVTGPPLQPPSPLLDPPLLHWSGLVLVTCVLGFAGGSLWGRRRAEGHDRAADRAGGRPEPRGRVWGRWRAEGQDRGADRAGGRLEPPGTLLQVLLVALFLLGAGALGWETFALARVQEQPDLWPITFYVRCANDVLGGPTLAGAVLVSTMVGHWLGYQATTGETD